MQLLLAAAAVDAVWCPPKQKYNPLPFYQERENVGMTPNEKTYRGSQWHSVDDGQSGDVYVWVHVTGYPRSLFPLSLFPLGSITLYLP
eukprot:59936-Amphidinium_carterae.1